MTGVNEAANTSTKSLLVGRHDGHADNHLNCVALRHGWTRNFSISPEEVKNLDYETLGNVLEVHTLKLRPVGVRVFVENPPDSGKWSKIRAWKDDGSLQSVLVQAFFEERRRDGVLTRIEVRDGADRAAEGDTMSLHSVASRIFHPRDSTAASGAQSTKSRPRPSRIVSWLGFGSSKGRNKPQPSVPGGENETQEEQELLDVPQKPSFFSLLRPSPNVEPASVRRSIFDFFRSRPAEPAPEPEPNPEEQKKAEEEVLRKRGWMPPGLQKRSRSLRDSLRNGNGNPFLGNSKPFIGRRKKHSTPENPFADEHAQNGEGGPVELTEQDIDEFFEIERPESMVLMDNQQGPDGKAWSRFKPAKEKKNKKKKGKGRALGSGADIVATPQDALPRPAQQESEVD